MPKLVPNPSWACSPMLIGRHPYFPGAARSHKRISSLHRSIVVQLVSSVGSGFGAIKLVRGWIQSKSLISSLPFSREKDGVRPDMGRTKYANGSSLCSIIRRKVSVSCPPAKPKRNRTQKEQDVFGRAMVGRSLRQLCPFRV